MINNNPLRIYSNLIFVRAFALSVIILTFCLPVKGQELPDSMVIVKNTYIRHSWVDPEERDTLYKTQKFVFVKNSGEYVSEDTSVSFLLVSELMDEIHDSKNRDNSLNRYGIDTNWIKINPEKLINISPYANRFNWNSEQKEFILKELVKIKYYQNGLNDYLNNGCCYTMHSNYRYEYVIKFYNKAQLTNQIISRRSIWGYLYPWTDTGNNKLYGFKIDNIVSNFINLQRKINEPLSGNRLLKELVKDVLEINTEELNRLASYTFESQMNDLKRIFTVTDSTKLTGYGGYFGEGPLLKLVLKTAEMLPNVSVEYLASIKNNKIYPGDSLINNYKSILGRVQSIKFIMNHLSKNTDEQLHILYFDNKTLNQYNIDGVNGKPGDWAKEDEYIKSMDWYKKNNYKPSFDINDAIKVSEQLYCGCNYRFPSDYLEKAIMFIIDDNEKNHSRWLLLPDNTILLFLMQGKKVLNYSYTDFGKYPGIQYPCIRFDSSGKIIPKVSK